MRFLAAVNLCMFIVGCEAEPAKTLRSVANSGSLAPHLASGPDEQLVLSWLERGEQQTHLRYAQFEDGDWSASKTLASGDNWFVNWADFPSVVPMGDALFAAHWLQKSASATYAYDVMLSLSSDAGTTWTEPFSPHSDGTPTEHGFVSLYKMDDAVGVLWLDGRETGDGASPMTLRSATVTSAGQIRSRRLVDKAVCDCCQTDVAIAASGPVAVYRDRTDREIRDIYVSRMIDSQWTEGVAVANDGWEIAGCPVNGPAISARGTELAVAWFTAADDKPRVRFARSSDSGAQFGEPLTLGSGQAIGRVGLLLLEDGSALLSWLRKREDGQADVVVTEVSAGNTIGKTTSVATTAAGSLSGVPQIALQGETVVFAWTGKQDERHQVLTGAISLNRLR